MAGRIFEARLLSYEQDKQGKYRQIHQEFIATKTHDEAITLLISSFSNNEATIKSVQKLSPGEFMQGSTPCWRYAYTIVLTDDQIEPGGEFPFMVILFSEYQDKEDWDASQQKKKEMKS